MAVKFSFETGSHGMRVLPRRQHPDPTGIGRYTGEVLREEVAITTPLLQCQCPARNLGMQ